MWPSSSSPQQPSSLKVLGLMLGIALIGRQQTHGFSLAAPGPRVETTLMATRSEVLHGSIAATGAALLTALPSSPSAAIPPQKSYSTNAKNMDRLNSGDASAGSVYDNNPSAPAARRRRAMQGCKIPSARRQAAQILGDKALSEKDCNMQAMESPDFMLTAMQELECPTCPYGVQP